MLRQTLQTSAELALWLEVVDVVASNIVLREVDDGAGKTDFTVVVARVLGNVTSKLCNLELLFQIALEARVEDLKKCSADEEKEIVHTISANLALARLETVNKRGNGAHVISHGEQNQLLVDKLAVANGIRVVVKECA